jgi:serine phosphatase RsbU (regulator of sigma subunit)
MFADSNYRESILPLNPGDVVITYTDGVVEVTNRRGEEWGVEGLLKAHLPGIRNVRRVLKT